MFFLFAGLRSVDGGFSERCWALGDGSRSAVCEGDEVRVVNYHSGVVEATEKLA